MKDEGWIAVEDGFDPKRLHQGETVYTLGNGYLGTRGAFEEGYPGAWPATLINGVFDDAPIVYTELANCPDWLPMAVLVQGERFRLDQGEVLAYQRRLDLYRAILSRDVRWRSPSGHTLELRWERFASLSDPHVLAIRCRITPLDFDGPIEIYASINSYTDNQGLMHWEWLDQGTAEAGGTCWLQVRTRHSAEKLGMAARLVVSGADAPPEACGCQGYPTIKLAFHAGRGETISADKVVAVFASRDVEEPAVAARKRLADLGSFDELRAAHEAAWEEVWRSSDVLVEGHARDQLAVRYNLFQTLVAAPWRDDRVSIPAKTLSGFGYRGHVFWDTEVFIVPFLTYTQPHVARNLLTYRYRTLPGARRKAKAAGYEGAMFAWESAGTGDEVTPKWVPDQRGDGLVRIWPGDIELHISADVAYAIWQYWQATGDDAWMADVGAQVILETARFWESCVRYNKERDRYELSDVIGPDEYHDHVDNNAFTNRMIQWHLEKALEVLAWLRDRHPGKAAELERQFDLRPERVRNWANILACMLVPHDPESGLIEQFEGFFDLEDVDLEDYEPRTRSMQVILGIEGANKRQVLKQADVLMLLYLLRDEYDDETLQVNWDYYNPRTDHTYGSSLGPAIHAILACELGKPQAAYEHFLRAALVDLENTRGNVADGIHAASAGGLWQTLVFGFGGLRFTGDGPVASPHLPPHWTRLRFRVQYRGEWYDFDLRQEVGSSKQQVVSSKWQVAGGKQEGAGGEQQRRGARGQERRGARGQGRRSAGEIRGVIFDLDGVLTDTSEFHYLGWKRLADEEGIPFDREANEALRGVSRRDSLMILLGGRRVTEEQVQEMMARKNRYYQGYLEGLTPDNLLPGALPLLHELRGAGVKVAIGSASKNAKTVIARLGIGELVNAISDGYSVERQKPAPDLFLHAAHQLGLEPEECAVVEDAESGIEAALAGGLWAVGIGPEERVGAAHAVFPSLEGVHWADIQARLRAAAMQEDS
jgi:beta-phosphoglucomutase